MMNSTDSNEKMPITLRGLVMLLCGVVLMALGYVLMAGGGVKDPQVFNYAMFDFQRLVAAPLVILAGIVVIVVAIVRKPKDSEQ